MDPQDIESGTRTMKVAIQGAACVASGICGFIAPKVFPNREEIGGIVELLGPNPPQTEGDVARETE
ncbi:hypothetical protein GCM10009628_12360 [Paeniglutamicibacter kerguelensis]